MEILTDAEKITGDALLKLLDSTIDGGNGRGGTVLKYVNRGTQGKCYEGENLEEFHGEGRKIVDKAMCNQVAVVGNAVEIMLLGLATGTGLIYRLPRGGLCHEFFPPFPRFIFL